MECCCESRVGTFVGYDFIHALGLHHEGDPCIDAGLTCCSEFAQMFRPALGRCVREVSGTISLQGAALDLKKELFLVWLHIEIDAGVSVCILRSDYIEVQFIQPLLHNSVCCLAVDVEKSGSGFFCSDKIILGFTLWVVGVFQIDSDSAYQEFLASSGVLDVHCCSNAVRQKHIGDESVRTVQKYRSCNIVVSHRKKPAVYAAGILSVAVIFVEIDIECVTGETGLQFFSDLVNKLVGIRFTEVYQKIKGNAVFFFLKVEAMFLKDRSVS